MNLLKLTKQDKMSGNQEDLSGIVTLTFGYFYVHSEEEKTI